MLSLLGFLDVRLRRSANTYSFDPLSEFNLYHLFIAVRRYTYECYRAFAIEMYIGERIRNGK